LFVAGEGQRSQGKGSKGCVLEERCVNDDVMSVVKYTEWMEMMKMKTPEGDMRGNANHVRAG
jgi:hypothetical protein